MQAAKFTAHRTLKGTTKICLESFRQSFWRPALSGNVQWKNSSRGRQPRSSDTAHHRAGRPPFWTIPPPGSRGAVRLFAQSGQFSDDRDVRNGLPSRSAAQAIDQRHLDRGVSVLRPICERRKFVCGRELRSSISRVRGV
ncbi:hypothetical protein BaRGS_00037977 [Batillaria attramentaria]|uniref:Uncharacterized protein n=1 Tax=Batillaria attramentaria TaxID=370345 RepID=A0ABD0J756_9CAEN